MLSMDMSSSGSNYDYEPTRHQMESKLGSHTSQNSAFQAPPIFLTQRVQKHDGSSVANDQRATTSAPLSQQAKIRSDRTSEKEEGSHSRKEEKKRKKVKKRDVRVYHKPNSQLQELQSSANFGSGRIRNIVIIEQPTEESLRLSPTRRSPSSRNAERRPSSLDINELGRFLKISQSQFRSLTPTIAKRMDKENRRKIEANSLERLEFNKKVHENSASVLELQQSYSDMKSFITTTFRDNEQKFRNVDRYIKEIIELRDRKLQARRAKQKRDTLTNSLVLSSVPNMSTPRVNQWKDTFGKPPSSRAMKSDNEKDSVSSESERQTKKLKSTVSDNPSESTFKQKRKHQISYKYKPQNERNKGEKDDFTLEIMRTFEDERKERNENGRKRNITPDILITQKCEDRATSPFTERSTCINTMTPLPQKVDTSSHHGITVSHFKEEEMDSLPQVITSSVTYRKQNNELYQEQKREREMDREIERKVLGSAPFVIQQQPCLADHQEVSEKRRQHLKLVEMKKKEQAVAEHLREESLLYKRRQLQAEADYRRQILLLERQKEARMLSQKRNQDMREIEQKRQDILEKRLRKERTEELLRKEEDATDPQFNKEFEDQFEKELEEEWVESQKRREQKENRDETRKHTFQRRSSNRRILFSKKKEIRSTINLKKKVIEFNSNRSTSTEELSQTNKLKSIVSQEQPKLVHNQSVTSRTSSLQKDSWQEGRDADSRVLLENFCSQLTQAIQEEVDGKSETNKKVAKHRFSISPREISLDKEMPEVSHTKWCFAEKYRRYLKRELLRQKLLKKEDTELQQNLTKVSKIATKIRQGVEQCLKANRDSACPLIETEHTESTFFRSQRKSTIEKLPEIDHTKFKTGGVVQKDETKDKLAWLFPLTQQGSDKSGKLREKQLGTKSAKILPFQRVYETEYKRIEEDFEPLPLFNQMVITKPRYLFTHRVKEDRPRMPALATLNQDQLSAEVRGIKQFGFNMVAAAAKHKQRLEMARLKNRKEKEQMNGERLMRGCLTERAMGGGSLGGLSSLDSETLLWRGE